MTLLLSILALMLFCRSFGRTDLCMLLAPAGSCIGFKNRYAIPVIIAVLMSGLLLSSYYSQKVAYSPEEHLFIIIGAVAAVGIGQLLSPYVSVVLAFVGAEIGRNLLFTGTLTLDPVLPLAWGLALVLTALLAALFRWMLSELITHIKAHYLRLMGWLGMTSMLLVIGLLLTLGFQLGLLFRIDIEGQWWIWAGVITVTALTIQLYVRNRIAMMAERIFDLNIASSIAIMASVLLVSAVFASETVMTAVGLHAVPLSPLLLVLAALGGCSAVMHRSVLDSETIIRIVVAAFVTPVTALLITCTLGTFVWNVKTPIDVQMELLVAAVVVAMTLMAGYTLRNYFFTRHSSRRVEEQEEQLHESRRELNRMEVERMRSENERLRNQLELKRREVMSVALNINEQKEFTEHLYRQIKEALAAGSPAEKDALLSDMRTELSQRMNFSSEIDSFYAQVEQLHRDFSIRLTEKYPKLTEQERRLTILLRLGFSTKYIATLMNISPKSVEVSRHRLRGKLGLARNQNLVEYIKTI